MRHALALLRAGVSLIAVLVATLLIVRDAPSYLSTIDFGAAWRNLRSPRAARRVRRSPF